MVALWESAALAGVQLECQRNHEPNEKVDVVEQISCEQSVADLLETKQWDLYMYNEQSQSLRLYICFSN